MKRIRHLLLLVLMLALPLQGVMAASRLCMAAPHSAPAETGALAHEAMMSSHAPIAHAVHAAALPAATAHDHDASRHAGHATHGAAVAPDQPAPAHDHAEGTCKLCAACCLTAAVAPALPSIALMSEGLADYRPIVVPVPHNVADGLERPPRTI